nr:hypothetical protein BdHM001_34700 [Bdellovibrio sp. HM001]
MSNDVSAAIKDRDQQIQDLKARIQSLEALVELLKNERANACPDKYPVLNAIKLLLETRQKCSVSKISKIAKLKDHQVLEVLRRNSQSGLKYLKNGDVGELSVLTTSRSKAYDAGLLFRYSKGNYGAYDTIDVKFQDRFKDSGIVTHAWYGGFGDSWETYHILRTPENEKVLRDAGLIEINELTYGHPLFLWTE